MAIFLSFLFLVLSFISVWIRRDPKIWLNFLLLSLVMGLMVGLVSPLGLLAIFGLGLLWVWFSEGQQRIWTFGLIVLVSLVFKLHVMGLFPPVSITQKFRLGLESPIVGLFPLALVVPVARSAKDWTQAFRGLLYGCAGIGIMVMIALGAGATHWHMKMPPFAWIVYLNNLLLVAIPEEAFFRGFLQKELSRYLNSNIWGLILSSMIFASAHIFWSPNFLILGFVFLPSLLYGGVYLISGKIESAILTHFLLNFIHITFFSYHTL